MQKPRRGGAFTVVHLIAAIVAQNPSKKQENPCFLYLNKAIKPKAADFCVKPEKSAAFGDLKELGTLRMKEFGGKPAMIGNARKKSRKSQFLIDTNLSYISPSLGGDNSENQSPQEIQKDTPPEHHALCQRLLPLVKGWNSTFIRFLLGRQVLHISQEQKLANIAKRYLPEESQGKARICRHCGAAAVLIDRFTYKCDRGCGVCLALDWHGGEL